MTLISTDISLQIESKTPQLSSAIIYSFVFRDLLSLYPTDNRLMLKTYFVEYRKDLYLIKRTSCSQLYNIFV